MKVYIGTDYEVGERARAWAEKNLPDDWEMGELDDCDVFISVLYKKLLPPEYFKGRRCYNFHCGVVPQYKGVGIAPWLIINGEDECGVSLLVMDKTIDGGKVVDIQTLPICEPFTGEDVFNIMQELAYVMFKDWFHKLLTGDFKAVKQKGKGKIYYRKDMEKAKDLTRFIRAFSSKTKESAYYTTKHGLRKYINLCEDLIP